jgi:hypothetical protein
MTTVEWCIVTNKGRSCHNRVKKRKRKRRRMSRRKDECRKKGREEGRHKSMRGKR